MVDIAGLIIEKVPELQEYRVPDCEVDFHVVRNALHASCVEIWLCKGGHWVLDNKKFEVVVQNEVPAVYPSQGGMTWEQAQALIETYQGKEKAMYDEAAAKLDKFASWAAPYIGYVFNAKIMNGVGDNKFGPQGGYQRQQAFMTMLRLYNYVTGAV